MRLSLIFLYDCIGVMIKETHLTEILNQHFSLPTFRKGQYEIIQSILKGQDTLAVLPTGGGKSLCYQLPAVFHQKLVVVISPLIALMKDQVQSLHKRGLRAGCLYSGQSENEKRAIFEEMRSDHHYLLYLSPERVQKPGFQNWIRNQKIALFAIDEAHCVSQWGHDFREEYGLLNLLKNLRPDVPILALTASATPTVLRDITRQLGLQKPTSHIHGFYRPNLFYQVEQCENEEMKFQFLLGAVKKFSSGRIIVYCNTRKSTQEIAQRLQSEKQACAFYHAGLKDELRQQIQQDYNNGHCRILVATNAFGMGVDHPDVRLVVHFHLPSTIDSLYQEMGRAGRDGRDSTCLLLYSKKDKGLQSFFIQQSEAREEIKAQRWRNLDTLIQYAEGSECRHSEILRYYRDSQRIQQCGHCDSCDPKSHRKVPLVATPPKIKKKKATSNHTVLELDSVQEERFQALRAWRRRKAQDLDLAAFVILSDRSLRELATIRPQKLEDLELIHGLGMVKIEKFGKEILAELKMSL